MLRPPRRRRSRPLIVGQDDKHGDVVRAPRSRRHGLDGRVRLPGPDGPGGAARASTAARARCACRAGCSPDDRDGIPNVLVEAMAAGAPVVASARLGHPRAGRRTRSTACSSRPRTRRRSPTRCCALHDDRALAARLARGGPRDGARALRRRPRWPAGSPRCSRRRAHDSAVARARSCCVIEHEHRDRDRRRRRSPRAASRSRARRARSAPSPTGSAPTLPADEEWRIEWVKFDYGLDLAHAYRDDRRRSATARRGSGSSRRGSAQVPARPRRRRGHRAPDPQLDLRLAAASAPAPARSTRLLADSIAAQARHVRANLAPERNHRTLELYALLIAALALPGLDRDGGCVDFAVAELDRNLAHGLPRRRRPPRGLDALPHDRAALVRRRARERAPLRARAARTASTTRLARACAFARALPPPGRHDPGAVGRRQRRLPRAARAGRPSCSARAQEPDASFPDGGYYVQRSGWDAGAQLPDLRLRPARRRRPRPLRPAQRRGVRRRAARWSSTPGAAPTPRSRRTCAAGSGARPRTTRSASTGSTRRRTRRSAPARARSPRAASSAARRRRARRARRRGAQPASTTPSTGAGSRSSTARYWVIEDRLRGRARAPLRPALPPRAGRARRHARRGRAPCSRPGLALRHRTAPSAIALEPGWVAPALRRARSTRRSSARVARGTSARFVTLLVPPATASRRRARTRRGRTAAGRDRRRARHDRPARRARRVGARASQVRESHDRAARARPRRPAPRRAARRRAARRRALLGAGRLRARAREVPRRREPARRLPRRGGGSATSPARTFPRRSAPRTTARAARAAPAGRVPGVAARARARHRALDVPATTAGSPRCRCSPAARRRSTGSSAGRVARRGWSPTPPSGPRPRACLDAPAACSRTRRSTPATAPRASARAHSTAAGARRPRACACRACSRARDDGALALEPLAGRRLDALRPATRPRAAPARRRARHAARVRAAARAALHRLDPDRLATRGRRDRPRPARRGRAAARAARRAARPARRTPPARRSACTAT